MKISVKAKENVKARVKATEGKLDRLKDLYINEMISMDAYKKDYERLSEELSNLTKMQIHQDKVPSYANDLLKAEDFISIYKDLSRAGQKRFWQSILSEIRFEQKPLKRNIKLEFDVTFRGF